MDTIVFSAEPFVFTLPSVGALELGYITIAEKLNLPFIPKRIYWTYYTPHNVTRGHHAHKKLRQVIIALKGTIKFTLENKHSDIFTFELNDPSQALYIPEGYWREIKFSHDAVLLCLASEEYDESDYQREYYKFKE